MSALTKLLGRWAIVRLDTGSRDFHPVCGSCDWIIDQDAPVLVIWQPLLLRKTYLCAEPHHGRASCAHTYRVGRGEKLDFPMVRIVGRSPAAIYRDDSICCHGHWGRGDDLHSGGWACPNCGVLYEYTTGGLVSCSRPGRTMRFAWRQRRALR